MGCLEEERLDMGDIIIKYECKVCNIVFVVTSINNQISCENCDVINDIWLEGKRVDVMENKIDLFVVNEDCK